MPARLEWLNDIRAPNAGLKSVELSSAEELAIHIERLAKVAEASSKTKAEELYNVRKWDNPEVVSTYEFKEDAAVYVGGVAGGRGNQVMLPGGVEPAQVLRRPSRQELE